MKNTLGPPERTISHERQGRRSVEAFFEAIFIEYKKMLKYFYTYILECSDKSYYTGITDDIERRLVEHNSNEFPKSYCHNRRPVKLVFAELFLQPEEAIEFEKQIKGWNRKKKEALIERNYNRLGELAKCKNETSHLKFNNDHIV